MILSPEQLESIASWAELGRGWASISIERLDSTETVLVTQGDDSIVVYGNGSTDSRYPR